MRYFILLGALLFISPLHASVHVFGDSHAKFSFSTIPGCQVHWLGPVTMHRIGRDGLQGLNIEKYGVKNKDTAIFVFGEIDVRCHVIPQCQKGRTLDEVLDTLVLRYINTILENQRQYKQLHAVIFLVLPPVGIVNSLNFPSRGSVQERVFATKRLNLLLEQAALQAGIDVLNVHDAYATSTGTLNPQLSDGNVHMNPQLNQPVLQQLASLLNKPKQLCCKNVEQCSIIEHITISR